jgi:hypothetical protein
MRKHFLLLFLMTLIPFYGWAADLSEIGATLIAPSYTYGTNHNVRVVINAVELNKRGAEPAATDEFYVKGYYNDNNGAKGAEIANFNYPTAITDLKLGRYSGIAAEIQKAETHGWTPITMSVNFNLTTYTSKKVGK